METCVAVIGTGFAGLSAALAVGDAGAEGLILETMPAEHERGNSGVSGNMWQTPTNLPEALEYIGAPCFGLTDQACLRALAEEMMRPNGWLETPGVKPRPLGFFQPELPGSRTGRRAQGSGRRGRPPGQADLHPGAPGGAARGAGIVPGLEVQRRREQRRGPVRRPDSRANEAARLYARPLRDSRNWIRPRIVRFTGVSIPQSAPRSNTAPLMQPTAVFRPARRSWRIGE